MMRGLFSASVIRRTALLAILAIIISSLMVGLFPAREVSAAPGDEGDPGALWLNQGNIKYRGLTYRKTDREKDDRPVFVVTSDWCTLAGGGFANKAAGGMLVLMNNQTVQLVPSANDSCQMPMGPYGVATVHNVRSQHIWFYRDGENGDAIYLYNNSSIVFSLTDVAPRNPYSGGKVYTRGGVSQGDQCPETILEHNGKFYLFPMMSLPAMNAVYPGSPSIYNISEDYTNVMTRGETVDCRVAPERVVLDYRIGQVAEFPANTDPWSNSYDGHNIGGSFCSEVLLPLGSLPRYFNEGWRGAFDGSDVLTHDVITTCEDQSGASSVRTAQRNKEHRIRTAQNLDGSREIHWEQQGIYEFILVDGTPDLAILGDDNGYIIAQGVSNVLTDNPTEEGAAEPPTNQPDPCSQNAGGFGWIICPMSDIFQSAANWIDGQITTLLKINACRIFHTSGTTMPGCSSSPNEIASSDAFYTAWKVFRSLAYALLVILGLAMVISQIAGMDFFDAYAIRKMLPKLVIATIIIPLLWPILKLLTEITNNSADAVDELIKAPFMFLQHNGTVGDWFTGLGLGIGTVLGAVAFGFIGGSGVLMALLLSIVIALAQALVVISARDMVFFILIIASPIAVVLSIFEPFKKGFTLWRRFLTGILLSIPAVAAVLAVSKVAAALSRVAHPELGVFFSLLFIIVGYLMFWPILKSLDKVAGQIDGLADKATGGIQKALSKYRGDTAKRRFAEGKAGRVFGFGSKGRLGGVANMAARLARRAEDSGRLGGPGFFSRGKHITAIQRGTEEAAKNMVKQDGNRWGGDDDTMEALAKHRDRTKAHRHLSRRLYDRARVAANKEGRQFDAAAERKKAETEAARRISGAETTFQGTVGTHEMQAAAAMALFASSTSLRHDPAILGEDGKALTAEQRLEEGRKILQEMQKDKVIDNQQAATIFTAHKGRERALSGFGAAMGYLAEDSTTTTAGFLRAGIEGSGPGAYAGQRWEVLVAGTPELGHWVEEAGVVASGYTLPPPQVRAARVDALVATGMQPSDAAKQVQVEIQRDIETARVAQADQGRARIRDRGTEIAVEMEQRAVTEIGDQARQRAIDAGITDQAIIDAEVAAAVQAQQPEIARRAAEEGPRRAEYEMLDAISDEQLDGIIEPVAAMGALHKVSGQLPRQNAKYLKEALAKEYTFGGVTKTGEQWVAAIESGAVPRRFAEKMRQAMFSYGAAGEAARQAGGIATGGQPGQTPTLVP